MTAPGVVGPGWDTSSLVQRVDLRFSCQNLPNRDIGSLSDPCAVLHMKQEGKYKEVGRTETVKNSLDPTFAKTITLDYHFEIVQKVRVRVYDVDNRTEKLKDDDFLGQVKCTLGQIVSNSPFTVTLCNKHKLPVPNCKMTVTAEEVRQNKEMAIFRFTAKKLDNKDFLSKSDPFLEVSRVLPGGEGCQVLHRTEVLKNSLNPEWRHFTLDLPTLCAGDWSRPVRLTVFDMDKNGSHDLIGLATTSMNEMIRAISGEVSWPCINETKKNKSKNYSDSGRIILSSLQMMKEFSFLEYIFGGLQINLTVGVDFTESNGRPDDPRSLHFVNPAEPNEYMKAISAVGAVLQDYDWDKLIPALGFGALVPPDMKESFEFPLNFDLQNPFCAGVQGVLDAYVNCLPHIRMYKPTKVDPIINHVIRFAQEAQRQEALGRGASGYYILLAADSEPGLDGDEQAVQTPDGQRVKRDIVQFVPFRKFKDGPPHELAGHVLAEIPGQVTEYFKMRKLPPNKTNYPYPVYPA
ncbi:Copine-3 [Bulinus truncatus]|nr:Copine-3 [Bulinus truncatus]